MKKTLVFVICIIMLFSLIGCKGQKPPGNDDKISIVTTIFPLYDFARQVAGDRAEVTLLLPTGTEVHSYEPTPQDIIKIKESDLFIHLGRDADPWTDAVIKDADGKKLNVLAAMECVRTVAEKDADGHNSVHLDQHIWTSPENAEEIVESIAERLCRIDRANASYYERNEEIYSDELSLLDDSFENLTEHKRLFMVFADRFPFRYFADEYNVKYFAAFPGCSSESEPSAATVSQLIDIVRKENIPVIFYTETSNEKLADIVCEETGAEKMLFHSCHTVTEEELKEGITYIDLMRRNYDAIKRLTLYA